MWWIAPGVSAPNESTAQSTPVRSSRTPRVDRIDVLPELGRRGIGRRLLDAVEVEAAARGLDPLTVVTDAHVPWNRAWYEGLRFRVIGPADRGPGVAAKLARESERGLDPRRRVSMRREL